MEKSPISFDLSIFFKIIINLFIKIDLFLKFADEKKENYGYNELVNYIYEMGCNMKMISLRQFDKELLKQQEELNKSNNILKFSNGLINIKSVGFQKKYFF